MVRLLNQELQGLLLVLHEQPAELITGFSRRFTRHFHLNRESAGHFFVPGRPLKVDFSRFFHQTLDRELSLHGVSCGHSTLVSLMRIGELLLRWSSKTDSSKSYLPNSVFTRPPQGLTTSNPTSISSKSQKINNQSVLAIFGWQAPILALLFCEPKTTDHTTHFFNRARVITNKFVMTLARLKLTAIFALRINS